MLRCKIAVCFSIIIGLRSLGLSQCAVSETHPDVMCFGAATGTVILTVIGGGTPFSSIWSSSFISKDLTGVLSGTYTVRVTDAGGCDITRQKVIAEGNALSPGSINTTLVRLCKGGTKPIGGTNAPYGPATGGSGNYLYTWQKQEGCSGYWTDIPGTNETSYTPPALVSTTCYRRQVTDLNIGTIAVTETKTIEIYPDLISQDIQPNPPNGKACSGGPVSAEFSGGGGGFPGAFSDTYFFSVNAGATWEVYSPGQLISTTGMEGNHLIQVRTRRIPTGVDACNYGKYVLFSWDLLPAPTPGLIVSQDHICEGQKVTFSGSGGIHYNFRVDEVSFQSGSSSIFETSELKNGQMVDVEVSNEKGCTSVSSKISMTINAKPMPNPIQHP